MIKVGDTVKVIGKTICGIAEAECIKIGTICKVIEVADNEKGKQIVALVPLEEFHGFNDYYVEWWYDEKDVEKGHLKWVKDK